MWLISVVMVMGWIINIKSNLTKFLKKLISSLTILRILIHRKVSFRIWFVWNLINHVQNTRGRKHVWWYIDFILYWLWFNLVNCRIDFSYYLIYLTNYLCPYINVLHVCTHYYQCFFTNYDLLTNINDIYIHILF